MVKGNFGTISGRKKKKNSENKKPKEETGEIEWSKVKVFVIIPLKG